MKPVNTRKLGSLRILSLFLAIAIFLAIAVNTVFYVQDLKRNYLLSLEQRSNSLVQSVVQEILTKYALFGALTAKQPLLEAEYLEIKHIYQANKQEQLSFISVLSPEGVIITHTDKRLWKTELKNPEIHQALTAKKLETRLVGAEYHTLVPVITVGSVHLCTIDVGFPKKVVDQKILAVIKRALVVGVTLFVSIFVPLWLLVRRMLITPIYQLISATSEIADGNLDKKIDASNTKEFADLSASLRHMRDSLRENIHDIERKDQEIRALIACSPVALFSIDKEQKVLIWTSSAQRLLGWSSEEVLQKRLPSVPEEDNDSFLALCDEVLGEKVVMGQELSQLKKDGTLFEASLSCAPVREQGGKIVGIMVALLDISDRVAKDLEHQSVQEQLVQAQKMESVGRLAGGVAHDYNNMLSVILGFAELSQGNISPEDPNSANLQQIINAARKSADITKKLLTFARKEKITPEAISLNTQIDNMLKMLRRLIGEDIELEWIPDKNLGVIMIDTVQVDQILANLCVNARDAMVDGGKISIETGNVSIDESYCCTHPSFVPGDFVFLRISDTGMGMDKKTLENIFEPFFTTKEAGKGTGLGLSTVYGIIKQNNGFINVYSELGNGTTFTMYFPRRSSGHTETSAKETVRSIDGHGEIVLLVEDEHAILEMVKTMCEIIGYKVLAADSAAKAIKVVQESDEKIELLLTDVILQDMNGTELAQYLMKMDHELKVIFMSGHSVDVLANRVLFNSELNFLQKPFTQKVLAKKIHQVLKRNEEQNSPASAGENK